MGVPGLILALSLWAAVAFAEPAVLDLLLKETPKPNYDVPLPEQVSGRVVVREGGREAGAEGISVSDGFSVAKTDADGMYALTPDARAVFINITRPSGYDVEGAWYKPLAAQVDFALTPAPNEDTYTFIHVSDTHLSDNPRALEGLSAFVREVNALDPRPRFVFNSGDLVNLSKTLSNPPETGHAWFRNYVGLMNHLAMPFYNVAGDHTDSSYRLDQFPRGDIRCGKPLFWEYLGPHFFSFEYGRIHFVSVDYGYHLGQIQRPAGEYPTNEVQPMHIDWLNQDMANRSDGTFVVTASENDLSKHCPDFDAMARRHDVRLQLVGDDHIVAYKEAFVPYRIGGALSGFWWDPDCKGLCPDLSPAGYLIYRVNGEEMECFYKSLGQRVAIGPPRHWAPCKGSVVVQAHIVQPEPDEILEYSLNGNDWHAMGETGRPFYRAVFEATIDTTSLPDGLLDFQVRSSQTGETLSREFVVVNGVTPAPADAGATLTFVAGQASHGQQRAPEGKVDVLFNDQVIGTLEPGATKAYKFSIPAATLRQANTLRFSFVDPRDGMTLTSPVLTIQDTAIRDPRDLLVNEVKVNHWGPESAQWGGFLVGEGALEEAPFWRRQVAFCFVLSAS